MLFDSIHLGFANSARKSSVAVKGQSSEILVTFFDIRSIRIGQGLSMYVKNELNFR
jgi:hypothetical protein